MRNVSLREVAAPVATVDEAAARDRIWQEAVRRNPTLFDGPITLLTEAVWDGMGDITLAWARGTYRNFALRRVPGATSWLPSLFVAVLQPTTDGRVIVGQMGGTTAAPGRWQFPGGTVDPPPAGQPLTSAYLHGHAALELREEIGVDLGADQLVLSMAIGADKGNVGFLFAAPPLDVAVVAQRYQVLSRVEAKRGLVPEFARIMAAGIADLPRLEPRVEYLDDVIHLHARDGRRPRSGRWGIDQG